MFGSGNTPRAAADTGDDGPPGSGARYSGLETPPMRRAGCSLLLQPHFAPFQPNVITLDPQRVVVPQDGGPPKKVSFQGCKILQLHPTGSRAGDQTEIVMPTILTVGGPCRYTKQDRRDFQIMMRSKDQARDMGLPPNGELDWPDCRAFETCPCCGSRAVTFEDAKSKKKKGTAANTIGTPFEDEDEVRPQYWMVFYPLIQANAEGMGMRTIARLVCPDCFEDLTENLSLRVTVRGIQPPIVQTIPLLDVVEDTGTITWLDRGAGMGKHGSGRILDAYPLYQVWEVTGTWQAMCNAWGDMFSEGLGGRVKVKPSKFDGYRSKKQRYGTGDEDSSSDDDDEDSAEWVVDRQSRTGEKCGGPGCDKVHGSKRVRLQECTGCREVLYCSTECQSQAWPEHKAACQARQEAIRAKKEAKKAKEKAEREAKMEEALASFVPLSLAPQSSGGGSGSGKKKGSKKKGGGGKGKKKKGKK